MEGLKSQITVEELGDSIKPRNYLRMQHKEITEMGNTKITGKHEEWIHKTQCLSNWCPRRKSSENGGETTSKEILDKMSPELKKTA